MSSPPFDAPPPHATPRDPMGTALRHARNVLLTVLAFVAVGVLAAVVWELVTVLPTETKQADGAGMDEAQLRQVFDADGWFMVISAGLGLAAGLVVELLRKGNAVVRVIAVAVAGLLAAWTMARVGLWLGPPDPATVLPTAADGTSVPLQLVLVTRSAYLIWPFTSVLGLLLVLLLRPRHDHDVLDGPQHPFGQMYEGNFYSPPYPQGESHRHE